MIRRQTRPPLFDFSAAARARVRAGRLAGDRFLDAAAVEGLADRLAAVTRKFEQGLVDRRSAVPQEIAPFARSTGSAPISMRRRCWPQTAPSIWPSACYSLQWINDLPGR